MTKTERRDGTEEREIICRVFTAEYAIITIERERERVEKQIL